MPTHTPSLCPPTQTASDLLAREVALRTRARLGRLRRSLEAVAPPHLHLIDTVRRAVRSLPAAERIRFLHGPDLRGFLAEAEAWIAIGRLAARLAADRSDRRALARLFERVSRTEYLVTLLPAGRIDRRFAERANRLARRRLAQVLGDLRAALLGLRIAWPDERPLALTLLFSEEPEQGRPGDRIDLGTICGRAGPIAITDRGRDAPPLPVRARLRNGTLVLSRSGSSAAVFPAVGSALRFAGRDPAGEEQTLSAGDGSRWALVRRALIPGTPILLAPALRSGPRRLRVGRPVARLGPKVSRALRILRIAWPEAHHEVLHRTAMVVPIREPGLVSYSLASRPGISYINVFGKTTLGLADDLLHETAHHLLHDLEEVAPLLTGGPATEEIQAFHSPWRGTLRPLHGLLHGTYTFLFRAELFRRILRGCRSNPLLRGLVGQAAASFVRRELRRERDQIGQGLRDLGRADRAGLLTARGRDLVRAMRSWYSRLSG